MTRIHINVERCENDPDLKRLNIYDEYSNRIHSFHGKHSWIETITIDQIDKIEFIVNAVLREMERRNGKLLAENATEIEPCRGELT